MTVHQAFEKVGEMIEGLFLADQFAVAAARLQQKYPNIAVEDASIFTCVINGCFYVGVKMRTSEGLLNLYVQCEGQVERIEKFEELIIEKGFAFQLLSQEVETVFN